MQYEIKHGKTTKNFNREKDIKGTYPIKATLPKAHVRLSKSNTLIDHQENQPDNNNKDDNIHKDVENNNKEEHQHDGLDLPAPSL
eukprot:13545089-Ditylum_brightwellii.AAC.1